MEKLPIIYVRGYAGTQDDVEETVDDPFYGFNKGATHVRVGPEGTARFFAFESPLVRLMSDEGYMDVFQGDTQAVDTSKISDLRRTVWIYRYYDVTSQTFEGFEDVRLSIEKAAEGLRQMIDDVRKQCDCRKVNLVAHSMGGLICRSLLQRGYPEAGLKSSDIVDKLFTYGTPHGGIHFDVGGGLLEWARDRIGWNNSDDFGKDRMYQYLLGDARKDAGGNPISKDDFCQNDLYGYFPPERVFCIIGTNAKDYDVAMGMSRRTVGPQSDGLVQMESAYVKGCSRAYLHRSHSGRYGMVNSEEGYQNLRRFLFGDVRVALSLVNIEIPAERKPEDKFYQAEVGVSLRGLPVLVDEQSTAHYCPIILKDSATQLKDSHHLFTFFLIPRETGIVNQKVARYAIHLAVYEFKKVNSWFDFSDHLEQTPIWSDFLIVDISCDTSGAAHQYSGSYCWNSANDLPNTAVTVINQGDKLAAEIPVPDKATTVLGSGKLVLEASRWV
jgi:pimeloyl-ACP methyl ester carboxylesterase